MASQHIDLTIVSAHDLKALSLFSKNQPFVLASTSPLVPPSSTRVSPNGGTSPSWHQRLSVPVPPTQQLARGDSFLVLEIRSRGALGSSVIGTVRIPLAEILQKPPDNNKVDTYQVRRPSGRAQGSLSVILKMAAAAGGEKVSAGEKIGAGDLKVGAAGEQTMGAGEKMEQAQPDAFASQPLPNQGLYPSLNDLDAYPPPVYHQVYPPPPPADASVEKTDWDSAKSQPVYPPPPPVENSANDEPVTAYSVYGTTSDPASKPYAQQHPAYNSSPYPAPNHQYPYHPSQYAYPPPQYPPPQYPPPQYPLYPAQPYPQSYYPPPSSSPMVPPQQQKSQRHGFGKAGLGLGAGLVGGALGGLLLGDVISDMSYDNGYDQGFDDSMGF